MRVFVLVAIVSGLACQQGSKGDTGAQGLWAQWACRAKLVVRASMHKSLCSRRSTGLHLVGWRRGRRGGRGVSWGRDEFGARRDPVNIRALDRVGDASSDTSPLVTADVYGHLDLDDMRAGVERLSFQPLDVPVEVQATLDWMIAKKLPMAVGASETAPHGAPVVRNTSREDSGPRARGENHQHSRAVELSGPTRIRTWNQAVMSRQLYR